MTTKNLHHGNDNQHPLDHFRTGSAAACCGLKLFSVCWLSLLLLFGCSGGAPEWQAASAARDYYECLVDGDAEGFLKGRAGADTLAADYREQLLTAVRQYQHDVERKHRGLRGVRIAEEHYRHGAAVSRDTSLRVVYAFLLLAYADSTQEEVAVPMVEHGGRWMMK